MDFKQMFLKGKMPDIRICDVHGHIGIFKGTTPENTDYKSVISAMERFGIEKTVISSADAIRGEVVSGNNDVYDAVNDSSGKLMGYVTVNPSCENGTVAEIKRFENKIMSGVKYHPNYAKTPITDEKMTECLRFINSKELILLVHAYSYNQVADVEEIAKKYPGIKIIAAHCGTQSGYKLTAEITKKYENVYCDISMSMPRANLLEYLIENGDENKVMFGSDTPLTEPSISIGRIMLADISDKAKEKVLGLNFLKLFENAKL